MSILKKTVYAGLAAITMATTGTAFTATSADAHSRYKTYSSHSCYYKKVWKRNYHGYGNGHWVTVKICN